VVDDVDRSALAFAADGCEFGIDAATFEFEASELVGQLEIVEASQGVDNGCQHESTTPTTSTKYNWKPNKYSQLRSNQERKSATAASSLAVASPADSASSRLRRPLNTSAHAGRLIVSVTSASAPSVGTATLLRT